MTEPGEVAVKHDVTLIGYTDLPSTDYERKNEHRPEDGRCAQKNATLQHPHVIAKKFRATVRDAPNAPAHPTCIAGTWRAFAQSVGWRQSVEFREEVWKREGATYITYHNPHCKPRENINLLLHNIHRILFLLKRRKPFN